jgi:hypothetical protein
MGLRSEHLRAVSSISSTRRTTRARMIPGSDSATRARTCARTRLSRCESPLVRSPRRNARRCGATALLCFRSPPTVLRPRRDMLVMRPPSSTKHLAMPPAAEPPRPSPKAARSARLGLCRAARTTGGPTRPPVRRLTATQAAKTPTSRSHLRLAVLDRRATSPAKANPVPLVSGDTKLPATSWQSTRLGKALRGNRLGVWTAHFADFGELIRADRRSDFAARWLG